MKHWLLFGLCLLLACAPQSKNALSVQLEPTGLRVGKRTLVLSINRDNKPLEGAQVSLEGTMTHAGMGAVTDTASELGGGKYRVAAFDFNMAGDWVLTVTAKTSTETLSGEVKLGVNP